MKAETLEHWREPRATAAEALSGPLAEPNVFYGPSLLPAALDHLDKPGAVNLVEARDAGGCFARLPVAPSRRHGRIAIGHVVNWVHPHCFYGAPLIVAGREREGWAAILAQLDAAEWAGAFLHLRLVDPTAPTTRALAALCADEGRAMIELHRHDRAILSSDMTAQDYWTANVNAKVRKEFRRKQNRLAECGFIDRRILNADDDLQQWCATFLSLERAGWKGNAGTALACAPPDSAFFKEICMASQASGALDMLRIDCDGRAIAMLVNFIEQGAGYSFKIAHDPAFARYSPGVLVEMLNLTRVLDDRRAVWMDSCAAPDHPMIDHIWRESRPIAQYRVALKRPGLGGLKARASRIAISGIESAARVLRHRSIA